MKPSAIRRLFVLSLLLLASAWSAATVWADDAPVAVPDVVGRSANEAAAMLEAIGFQVATVDIADGTAGLVHSQVPAAETIRPKGSEVELRVGTDLRIQTEAPDARGKTLADAIEAYGNAYVLEVELVDGPEDKQGQVVDQEPKPATPLLFRGVLRLFAVQEPAPAGVIVPAVLGKSESEARALIEDVGLRVSVSYVQDPVADEGIVVSQEPACCGEILAGGLVALRVNGEPPSDTESRVAMPDVVGLTMHEASHAVLMAGLVPQVAFRVEPGAAAWLTLEQHPEAGELVPLGDNVRVVVRLPSKKPAQVRVPPLYGLTAADAATVLSALDLSAHVIEQYSLYNAGRVFGQSPGSGSYVAAGSSVTVRVAKAPPGGWQPTGVRVPSVVGLKPVQAFVKLLAAGLWGQEKHHVSPGGTLGRVDTQHPAAGSIVGPGTKVRFYLPKSTTVPTLVGSTKAKALQKLLQAGLNGAAHGPAFGFGTTKVTSQASAAGTSIASGTTIHFAYVYTGGVGPLKVKVPHLIGKTKAKAALLLQTKGLNGQFVGPNFGLGSSKVTSQNPAANSVVLLGSTVTAHYVYVGGPLQPMVKVPHLLGKTKGQALQALQAKGLKALFLGPAFGIGLTKVTSQNPPAGALLKLGSTVKVHYVFGGGFQPLKVKVPHVVGKTKGSAAALLQAKGLKVSFTGPNLGLGTPKVIAQFPGANVLVPVGSTVKLKIKYFGGVIGIKVKVPNLHNMSKAQALSALQSRGLVAVFYGPQFGFGTTKVVSQQPQAGTLVMKGSKVKAKYVFAGAVVPFKVKVPHVIGKTRNQAKSKILAAGLKAKFVGALFGIGTPRVVAQSPHGNQLVPKGSTVTMVIKYQ